MPKYVFTGPVPMIFGDFRHGEGIMVNGVEDKDGQTVVLRLNDSIVSETPIIHAFLTEMPETPASPDKKTAKKPVETAVETVPESVVVDEPTADQPTPANKD